MTRSKTLLQTPGRASTVLQGSSLEDVTPSDVNSIAPCVLFIGTGGDLKVTGEHGGTVVFKNLPDAYELPIKVVKVWADETTASDIIAVR